jgi:general secretion pathway protein A
VLEQLRMLTNINAGKDVLLQLVLIGQPELRNTIARPDLSQFVQRVAASCHLSAMDAATVSDYVAHRMQTAGSSLPIFTPEALQAVAAATGGVPRLVNQLCDLSLVHAYATDRGRVTGLTVGQVLDEGVFLACTARQPQQREAVG